MVLLGIKPEQYHFLCLRFQKFQKIWAVDVFNCFKMKREYMKQSAKKVY